MNVNRAARRYHMGFIPAMTVFLAGSLGLVWLDANADPGPWIMAALAVIPVVALLSMFWLHWRFMQDVDEFLRKIQVNSILCAAAVVLAIATGWGYMENFVDAPALSVFWLNPIFWATYGIAATIFTRREGAGPI